MTQLVHFEKNTGQNLALSLDYIRIQIQVSCVKTLTAVNALHFPASIYFLCLFSSKHFSIKMNKFSQK